MIMHYQGTWLHLNILLTIIILHVHAQDVGSSKTPVTSNTSALYEESASKYVLELTKLYKCQLYVEVRQNKSKSDCNTNATLQGSAGVLIKGCGARTYLFSNTKIRMVEIWNECGKLNMVPASIENKSQVQCLHLNYYFKSGSYGSPLFVTGQLDANLDRRMISCVTNKTVSPDVWLEGEPDNDMKREACVALKFDNKTAGLADIRCGIIANFVCENIPCNDASQASTDIITPVTTQFATTGNMTLQSFNSSVSKNSTIPKKLVIITFGKDGIKKTVANYSDILALTAVTMNNKTGLPEYSNVIKNDYKKLQPNICEAIDCNSRIPRKEYNLENLVKANGTSRGYILTHCGNKHFLFTRQSYVLALKNKHYCCPFGMTSAVIETLDELHCLHSFIKVLLDKNNSTRNSTKNMMFGTGLMDHSLQRQFLTCPNKTTLNDKLWKPKQPNNANGMESCIAVNFQKEKEESGFDDMDCMDYVFPMCQYIPGQSANKSANITMTIATTQSPLEQVATSTYSPPSTKSVAQDNPNTPLSNLTRNDVEDSSRKSSATKPATQNPATRVIQSSVVTSIQIPVKSQAASTTKSSVTKPMPASSAKLGEKIAKSKQ